MKEQINRIKEKLKIAKKADKKLKVFGASNHKYALKAPIEEKKLAALEKKHGVSLPAHFRAFLLEIADGGGGFDGSAPGPFYGIYPIKDALKFSATYLANPCLLRPKMSDEQWRAIGGFAYEQECDDEENEEEKILGGVLLIGTQGCSFETAIVIEGEFRGRIVNLDFDLYKPVFAFESNFLDWYERWLDEVISGELKDGGGGFGYYMGGSASELLQIYEEARNRGDTELKNDCLDALTHKAPRFETQILDKIESFIKNEAYSEDFAKLANILCANDFARGKAYLARLAQIDYLLFLQIIHWWAKDKKAASREFMSIADENAARILNQKDEERAAQTFRFYTYLLENAKLDYGAKIEHFATSPNYSIRVTCFYALGQLKNKSKYLKTLILGLSDEEPYVVTTALQAVCGLTDERLLPHLKAIAQRFLKDDENSVVTNLNRVLEPYGLDNKKIKKMEFKVEI